jgi:hypothetical protein
MKRIWCLMALAVPAFSRQQLMLADLERMALAASQPAQSRADVRAAAARSTGGAVSNPVGASDPWLADRSCGAAIGRFRRTAHRHGRQAGVGARPRLKVVWRLSKCRKPNGCAH